RRVPPSRVHHARARRARLDQALDGPALRRGRVPRRHRPRRRAARIARTRGTGARDMILILALVVGVLFTGGTYLLLQRTLTRTILGLVLYGHAVNVLLLLAGGRAGAPPIVDGSNAPIADPLT